MDIAARNGSDLRRWLASAERLSDAAIARAERCVNTPGARSSALLMRPTVADQRVPRLPRCGVWLATLFMGPRAETVSNWSGCGRPRFPPPRPGVGHSPQQVRTGADGPDAGCVVT